MVRLHDRPQLIYFLRSFFNKMLSYKILCIDETGKASYSHLSELFVLSGVIIPESLQAKIDNQVRKLKKKYLKDEDEIFHSRDMSRRKGKFSIFKDSKIEVNFWSDFVSILNRPEISIFFIVVNKQNAKKASWQPKTILVRSYLRILSEFAKHLKVNKCCGKIINESEPSQDIYLITSHNRLQSMGTGDGSVSAYEYKGMVTSLSLVSKINNDVAIQIADALAPIAVLRYKKSSQNQIKKLTHPEKIKYNLIERKLADTTNPSLFEILI